MKSYIKPHKDDALWLIVERTTKPIDKTSVEYLKGQVRDEDDDHNVAYPILKDEVEAIKEACDEYLAKTGKIGWKIDGFGDINPNKFKRAKTYRERTE